jgi:hypothetical protein
MMEACIRKSGRSPALAQHPSDVEASRLGGSILSCVGAEPKVVVSDISSSGAKIIVDGIGNIPARFELEFTRCAYVI